MLLKKNTITLHLLDNKGIGVYKIISIVGLLILAFILILPQAMDIQRRENAEQCVSNMREIYDAVNRYMSERNEHFSGDTQDLNRTGYLRRAIYVCPSGTPESHYYIEGDKDTGEVIVRCPLHIEDPEEYSGHVLPEQN